MKRFVIYPIFIFLPLVLTACGSNSSSGAASGSGETPDATATTASYKIDYTNVMGPMMGKSVFALNITPATSSARVATRIERPTAHSSDGISGLEVTVTPWMIMPDMEHGSPVGSVVDNGQGHYTITVYYLMASVMNGMDMGSWELRVNVNGESATFYPTVSMSMGSTAVVKLKNENDKIAGMTGEAETRSYYLFKDSLTGATGSHSFSVFLATRESMMSHPAVYTGKELRNEAGTGWTVNRVTMQASTDAVTWVNMTENGSGYWSVSGLQGLTDQVEGEIYLKMSINGARYTTDGMAESGQNGYQVFTVIPGSSM